MADHLLPIPDVPEGLREAAQIGTLIPFIGAGVSRLAGCPNWTTFADEALKSLIDQGKLSYSQHEQIRHLNPRVKLSIARSLEEEHRISIDYRSILHRGELHEHKEGCRLYDTLFRLGNIFVTTNYDMWLDQRIPVPAVSVTPPSAPVNTVTVTPMRVIHRVVDFLPAVLGEPNTVVHLHGSVHEPKGMILTTRDYLEHYANDRLSASSGGSENRVLRLLEDLFRHKTVLFIGYGLEELEILEYVILKAGQGRGGGKEVRHFLLQGFFSHEDALRRTLKSYYRDQCGIELIPFLLDNKNWGQLVDVLEQFAQRVPVSAPGVLLKAQEMEDWLNG
jgi:hypothetical protein